MKNIIRVLACAAFVAVIGAGCERSSTPAAPPATGSIGDPGSGHGNDAQAVPPLGQSGSLNGIIDGAPTPQKPVVAGAVLRPARVRPGETLQLVVLARIAPGWHIYPATPSPSLGVPTSLRLRLPEGVKQEGGWKYPDGIQGSEDESAHYEGELRFELRLRVVGDAPPGPLRIGCDFGYQACDLFSCRPPAVQLLSVEAEVIAVP